MTESMRWEVTITVRHNRCFAFAEAKSRPSGLVVSRLA
jgi:hypothetical protein